jgi:hypothetical protein
MWFSWRNKHRSKIRKTQKIILRRYWSKSTAELRLKKPTVRIGLSWQINARNFKKKRMPFSARTCQSLHKISNFPQ